jgi:hypothetical protein
MYVLQKTFCIARGDFMMKSLVLKNFFNQLLRFFFNWPAGAVDDRFFHIECWDIM